MQVAKERNRPAQAQSSEGLNRKESTTETIFPVSFYARAGENSGLEIVAVSRMGEHFIFRLNDRQFVHLVNDTMAMMLKRMLTAFHETV